jgi:phospholipid/cholesterol/gamma-HCH transport system permease protein
MSILGGMIMGDLFAGVNPEEYLRYIPTIVTWPSIVVGLIKCFVFSTLLATVCTYRGYTTTGGAKGVGISVVGTAVTTMIGIVASDWIVSFIADRILRMVLES